MFKNRNNSGQGLVEYILIIALIALLVLGAVKLFGKKTRSGFEKAAKTIDKEVQTSITDGQKEPE
jgi:Flp pilus assembly pilin Flp